MSTHRLSLLNHTLSLGTGGKMYLSPIDTQLTMTNAKKSLAFVMEFPVGADVDCELSFDVPQDYVGTPVLIIKGILNGTPASTLAFGADTVQVDDSETVDVAFADTDLANNSTWTGYADEDFYEETITITPTVAFVAGREVFLKFYRDDSVDTSTFDFLLTQLLFEYSDT